MKTVYVAGAMSADNILDVLSNINRGIKLGSEVLEAGFAPFTPHLDVFYRMLRGDDLGVSTVSYYAYSMEFLKKCDYVIVCEKSENSVGTIAELKEAYELDIPVFYSIQDMLNFDYDNCDYEEGCVD